MAESQNQKQLKPVGGIHAVAEVLASGVPIDKMVLEKGPKNPRIRELVTLAREMGIRIQEVPFIKGGNLNHQGIMLYLSAVEFQPLDQIVMSRFEEGVDPFILILDQVNDVRNFGAICRTAHIAGVNAVVIPEKGSAAIGADAMKTSSGALSHIPVCREKDLLKTIKLLKESGISVMALTEKGNNNIFETDLTGPVAILAGSEGIHSAATNRNQKRSKGIAKRRKTKSRNGRNPPPGTSVSSVIR